MSWFQYSVLGWRLVVFVRFNLTLVQVDAVEESQVGKVGLPPPESVANKAAGAEPTLPTYHCLRAIGFLVGVFLDSLL